MFIETIKVFEDQIGKEFKLAFLKSSLVQAFPCGRRRSSRDANNDGKIDNNETKMIPFDPEARLNTEANNRRHSGLNGYTQTYLDSWKADLATDNAGLLTMSLAGYLFNVTLENVIIDDTTEPATTEDYRDIEIFVKKLLEALETPDTDVDRIYANINIEDVDLFTGFKKYTTSVLSTQKEAAVHRDVVLDLLCANTADYTNSENYYFSGLSFSTVPLTAKPSLAAPENYPDGYTYQIETYDTVPNTVNRNGTAIKQTLVSLCILEKVLDETDKTGGEEGTWKWQLYQPALLPKIEHGTTTDSIVVSGDALLKRNLEVTGNIDVTDITAKDITAEDITAVSITVPYDGEDEDAATSIDASGVSTPFISADLIDAEDVVVGNEIGIAGTDEEGNPVVVTTVGTDITTKGNIEAEGTISAPCFEATTQADIKKAIIEEADIGTANIETANVSIKANIHNEDSNAELFADIAEITEATVTNKLDVHNDNDTAQANIDNAIIKEAEITYKTTITGELTVKNEDPAKAAFDNALVTGVLVVTNPERDPGNPKYDPEASPASIVADYAGIDEISAGTVEANDIQQKTSDDDNAPYYKVPVIFVQPITTGDKTEYQLQIAKANILPQQDN